MAENNNMIKVKCICGEEIDIDLTDTNLSWEIVETDEREMGTERLYEAEYEVDCCNCNETVSITFHVWEYPEGVCNDQEILVDGGELIEECNLGGFVLDDYGKDNEEY